MQRLQTWTEKVASSIVVRKCTLLEDVVAYRQPFYIPHEIVVTGYVIVVVCVSKWHIIKIFACVIVFVAKGTFLERAKKL